MKSVLGDCSWWFHVVFDGGCYYIVITLQYCFRFDFQVLRAARMDIAAFALEGSRFRFSF